MTGGPAPARPQGTPRAWGTILFGVPSSLWSRDGEVSSRLEPEATDTHTHTFPQGAHHIADASAGEESFASAKVQQQSASCRKTIRR